MMTFTIQPTLGIKNDVPADDEKMFEFISEGLAKTYCTDSSYVGYQNYYVNIEGAANKVGGRTHYLTTDAAVASGTLYVKTLFQYTESTAPETILFVSNNDDDGRIYIHNSATGVRQMSNGAGADNLWCIDADTNISHVRVGSNLVFCDGVVSDSKTPYVINFGNAITSKLIGAGTEYKFRFIEFFQNRFVGAYSDQTYGLREVRYSNVNPTIPNYSLSVDSDVEFAAANQFYTKEYETITALKRLDKARLLLYTGNTIQQISYNGNYQAPFSIEVIKEGITCHAYLSIVSANGVHFFYDKNYGFIAFDGYNAKIISKDIQDIIDTFNPYSEGSSYPTKYIVGAHLPASNEVCWTYSTSGTSNTGILYYNYKTGHWRKDLLSAKYITTGRIASNNEKLYLMTVPESSGNINYAHFAGSDLGASWTAYRIEPVLNFGGMNKSLLLEIWFNMSYDSAFGSEVLDVYYRGSDTVGHLLNKSWSTLNTVLLSNPGTAVCRTSQHNRYHQIKWGNDNNTDMFSVREIQFKYVQEGRY